MIRTKVSLGSVICNSDSIIHKPMADILLQAQEFEMKVSHNVLSLNIRVTASGYALRVSTS